MPRVSENDSWLARLKVKCSVFERLPCEIKELKNSSLDYCILLVFCTGFPHNPMFYLYVEVLFKLVLQLQQENGYTSLL